jgi:malate synthase
MTDYVKVGNLHVATVLYEFINDEGLPKSNLDQGKFWTDFEKLLNDLAPKNHQLISSRDEIQKTINTWHRENQNFTFAEYKCFLQEIGYLEPEVEDFQITTENVDDEVAVQAGPQLVVPLDNARYALNAANARWGSLYNALYGTDTISEEDGAHREGDYNPFRGEKVISFGKDFLDRAAPLKEYSHHDVIKYAVVGGELVVTLSNGEATGLQEKAKLKGYQGNSDEPTAVLLQNNRMHFEIQIDRSDQIGKTDLAGVKDILMESALSTIMDCEDSVAAVDADDKVLVYRNWLGLMRGDLTASLKKNNKKIIRKMNPDRIYSGPNGKEVLLQGRSLMFIRNVGHLMTTNAILDANGKEIPEGIMDTVITSLLAKHSLLGNTEYQNSSKGSVYIVKPKMHGSKEVAFANELFNRVEDMLDFKRNTLKIGVMDEERRTSLNLKACIRQVRERVAFINTGFLDRTGDEIHTSMEMGPMDVKVI